MAGKQPERYEGSIVFVNGVHYPVGDDGHADTSKGGLRVADDGGWRYAGDDEPLHNDVHHAVEIALPVGGE